MKECALEVDPIGPPCEASEFYENEVDAPVAAPLATIKLVARRSATKAVKKTQAV